MGDPAGRAAPLPRPLRRLEPPPISWTRKKSPRDGRPFHVRRSAVEVRPLATGASRRDVREGVRPRIRRQGAWRARRGREKPAEDVLRDREGRPSCHGEEAGQARLRDQGRGGERRGRRGHAQARGDGAPRDRERDAAEAVVQAVPRGQRGGTQAQAQGQAEGPRREGRPEGARAGARGARPQARGAGGVPK